MQVAAGQFIQQFYDQRHRLSPMRIALIAALLLHILLAVVFPDLPKLVIPSIDRGSSLNVFIRASAPEQEFDQSLEQPLPKSTDLNNQTDTALSLVSPEQGEDDLPTEAAPEQDGRATTADEQTASTKKSETGKTSSVVVSFSMVRRFAQNYVAQEALLDSEIVERRRNRYRSDFSVKRRSNTDSFQNRFGDVYVRSDTSRGDICYLQRAEPTQDELAVNVVQFYRCDREPLKLDLSKRSG